MHWAGERYECSTDQYCPHDTYDAYNCPGDACDGAYIERNAPMAIAIIMMVFCVIPFLLKPSIVAELRKRLKTKNSIYAEVDKKPSDVELGSKTAATGTKNPTLAEQTASAKEVHNRSSEYLRKMFPVASGGKQLDVKFENVNFVTSDNGKRIIAGVSGHFRKGTNNGT